MVDIATLGVAVDATDLRDGEARLNSFASTGEKTERRIERSSRDMSKALATTGAATRRFDTRNIALQLSQVAQQASATGDPLRALAIQLPDLAIGFGTLGIAIGAVAGALAPLAISLFSSTDATMSAAKATRELEEELASLNEQTEMAAKGARSLAELRIINEIAALTVELADATTKLEEAEASRGAQATRAGREARAQIDRTNDQIGALGDLLQKYRDAAASAGIYQSASSALRIEIDGTTSSIRGLVDAMNLANAAEAGFSMSAQGGRGTVVPSRTDAILASMGGINPEDRQRKQSGTTARANAASREQLNLERARDRVLQSLKSNQDIYNDALREATELQEAGLITGAQYQEYMDRLNLDLAREQFSDATQTVDEFSDALFSGIDSVRDFVDSALREFARFQFSEGLKGLLGLPQSSGGGGIIGSIFAGFFDQGGRIPSGQFGIAGENGPEIVPGPATVISTRDTANLLSSGVSEVIVRMDVPQGVTIQEVRQVSGEMAVTVMAESNRQVSERQKRS